MRASEHSAGDVRAIIDRHNSELEKLYASGEIDAVARVFSEDAWQMPPNQPPLIGREAIRAAQQIAEDDPPWPST